MTTTPPAPRSETVQDTPSAGLDLTGFPTATLEDGTALFRAHTVGYGPWYFDNTAGDEGGRFNLTGPKGTCYVADTPEAALRERFGKKLSRNRWIDTDSVGRTVVSLLTVGRTRETALISTPDAAAYEITTELAGAVSYDISQAWAARFDAEPFDGIYYTARFSAGGPANAWAVFGPTGEHTEGEDPVTVPAAGVCRGVGIEVRDPAAHPADLTVIRPMPLVNPVPDP
ncbi:RES family NAD+ phosphorylase [Leifsonia sp. L25]|uniref:RES family NAD+ phosphorylase n=1 Tax=Actinomycetes TaxID=1760 RepID=UPI003D694A0B